MSNNPSHRAPRATRAARRAAAAALLVSALLGSFACVRRDLSGMCQLAKDVVYEPRHKPADRMQVFMNQVDGVVYASDTRALLQKLVAAPPEGRYAMVRAFAAEHEAPQWKCAQLEAVIGPTPAQRASAARPVESAGDHERRMTPDRPSP